MKPIDMFTENSERICIEVATEQGRHGSSFSIEVAVQPHAQIRVCWGGQHYNDASTTLR